MALQYCMTFHHFALMSLIDKLWHRIAIPQAVFAYIGVELVTVTAFEAKNPKDLRLPAKNISYVVLIIYAVTVGVISANVEWFDQNLPLFYSQSLISTDGADVNTLGHSPIVDQTRGLLGTTFAPVIATLEAGLSYIPVASVLLGFLVYSALSCANVNLYVASRTLYGLTRDLDLNSRNWFESFFAHLNVVTPRWRVPIWSVIASIICIASWLPFVKLGLNEEEVSSESTFNFSSSASTEAIQLFQIMSSIGTVGVLLVWASQCLAFIRYNKWYVWSPQTQFCMVINIHVIARLWVNKEELTGEHYERFQRWPMKNKFSSYAAALQPFPAYLGLVSCLVIVLVFNSAAMWNGNKLLFKALNIYLAVRIT